ncbi:O-acetyl-ADP-ribose deacetylase [Anaeromicrobium sediminis]|uniref:O-acetyl-ADP-ribose deacetylase n=1 Tax=Anaeromicrobium sediminis TaxID=1478221 RepID=A0A267MKR5_9FIRM|nr:O-acetyl-ADP-ribose deacetylase [Anaeromicrobium sediminis]PAB60002.1 O-acetyl-ADP-ribose deacetylase [Anaeromicrobium sediminis]
MKEYMYKSTKISIIKGNITKIKIDAIVNAANNSLLGGGGVDGAIHRAGGPDILKECKTIGGCPTGEARITGAGKLDAKYVIHTVGPIYRGGNNHEESLLYNAYNSSLTLGGENNIKTIAFPAISTGAYSYPIDEAADIAIKAILDFIDKNNSLEEIMLVLFSQGDYDLYERKLNRI